jgi:hypothetical protein
MKGVVFTEFLEMVENAHSPLMAEQLLMETEPESGGAYTSVGTYDYQELVAMVCQLGRHTGTPVPELLHAFGRYMFGRFLAGFPQFFEGETSALEFLPKVDGYIHGEVRKLYADAELPEFTTENAPGMLTMTYTSSKPLAKFAEGMIEAAIAHFGKPVNLTVQDLSNGAGTHARFVLRDAA